MKKIIWNITKNCGFHCRMCATRSDGRRELAAEDKRRILLKIISQLSDVEEIDFAGGDPLADRDSRKIISEAIDQLGRERISVTTTGLGIRQLSEAERERFLYRCELSLDNVGDTQIRGETRYGQVTLAAIWENLRYFKELTINIPILKTDVPERQLAQLVHTLNDLPVPELGVNLLRYMPVGGAAGGDYPKSYAPKGVIDYMRENLRKDMKLHIHCAMRGLTGTAENCSMLNRKIGLDCAGNVFICPWAGYLPGIKEKNPFYLGNALEQDFPELLNGERAVGIKEKLKSNSRCCPIFSYLNSHNQDMFSGCDPLYESEECNYD